MDIKFCLVSAAVGVAGRPMPQQLQRGQVWRADDPVVKQYPDYFADEPPIVHSSELPTSRPVEDATAEPGRKRTIR